MYSTCIFCHSSLGSNEAVEHFPVGRRLAFDAARGRLWVVCRACGRWNLSPLEERWEAVEECERSFRDTRVRVSTENIGLARLGEGTELVRIGAPQRPEFAGWRYGDQFGVRARRMWMRGVAAGGVGAAAAGAALVAAPYLVLMLPSLLSLALLRRTAPGGLPRGRAPRTHHDLRGDDGDAIVRPDEMVTFARLRTEDAGGEGWWLEVRTGRWEARRSLFVDERKHELHHGPAVEAASVLLAGANRWGGSQREVRNAVGRIERVGHPERYFAEAEGEARKMGWGYRDLWHMPAEIRFALEMAAHEEAERRAMEGELAELERRWRAAEEIAAIADRLVIPAEVERKLDRMRRRTG